LNRFEEKKRQVQQIISELEGSSSIILWASSDTNRVSLRGAIEIEYEGRVCRYVGHLAYVTVDNLEEAMILAETVEGVSDVTYTRKLDNKLEF